MFALLLLALSTPSIAQTYTLTATVHFDTAESNAIAGLDSAINTLIPDGATLRYIFDFDAAAADLNGDPQVGNYQGVITGRSLKIGDYTFTGASPPCLNPALDCRVDVVSQPLFATWLLVSERGQSTPLADDLVVALSLTPGQFDFPVVGSSVSLNFSQSGPFATGDAIQLPDALSPLSGALALDPFPNSLFSTDASFTRITYTLDNINVVEGAITRYTLNASVNYDSIEANAIAGLDTATQNLIPDGTQLHYVFDFDADALDLNADSQIGNYQGVITGRSLKIGNYTFTGASPPCLNPALDCRVDVVSQATFATWLLVSERGQSTPLADDLVAALSLTPGQFDFPVVGSSVSLNYSQAGPFAAGDAIQPPDALSPLSGALALDPFPTSLFSTNGSFARITYTLDDISLIEGEAAQPEGTPINVPLPIWLLKLLGLSFFVIASASFAARQRLN